jgi:hypothetical protein
MVRHDQKDWVDCVDMTKFAINADVTATIIRELDMSLMEWG